MKKTILLFWCLFLLYSVGFTQTTPPADVPKPQAVGSIASRLAAPDLKEVTVYPNPSNGIIHVTFTGFKGKKTELRVMNVIGNVVHREILSDLDDRETKTVDLSKYTNGLYYVKLQSDDFSQIRKVILN